LDSTVAVSADGTISVPLAGKTMAAGLTPAQLEGSLAKRLGPLSNSQVRIEQSASQDTQPVTFLVPLDASEEHSHVFGQVTNSGGRVVQSFEADVSGQPAVAKVMLMRAGTYRLKVIVKNEGTGVIRTAALDFTVD
jgi:hypothetical protein